MDGSLTNCYIAHMNI